MKRTWPSVVLTAIAIAVAGLSIPLYLVAMIGVGMSPSNPHLGVSGISLLWTPPLICIVASVALGRIQGPVRLWRWIVTIPMVLLSTIEAIWALLMFLKG